MKKIFKTNQNDINTRLDKWLKRKFSSLNQSFIEKNLRKGFIKINNKKTLSKYKLLLNDKIIIYNYSKLSYKHTPKIFVKKEIPKNITSKFNSSIIYENKNFLILNKWTGVATQGGSKINISIDHIIKNISLDYNLVHRLDKETSGLLIIAKNLQYTKIFSKLFKQHNIKKKYIAFCSGFPKKNESNLKLFISNKEKNNKNIQTITRYKLLNKKNNISIILFNPLTGKTHQLRIVSKYLGCPIIGDNKYNKNTIFSSEKLKLNAYSLQFNIEKKEYNFISELPSHFIDFLKKNNFKFSINKSFSNF